MNRHIRRMAAAASLLGAVAGCTRDALPKDDAPFTGIAGTLIQQVMSRRGAPAEPAAAPDLQMIAAEAMAVNPGPLIMVGLESLGTTRVLAMTGENGAMRTFMTSNDQALILRGFMLSGTRGLGHDLSVAEADQSAAMIASGRSGTARRVMRYYSADGLERPLEFTCKIGPGPNAGVMVEDCNGHGLNFQNSYLPSAGVSRQWVGPRIGYATVQVLRD